MDVRMNKKHKVFWLLNDRLTKSGIRSQLKKMADAGIGGVFFHAMPDDFAPERFPDGLPGYLSKRWFDMIRYAVLTAAEFGMESCLYDEGGWPSGKANGIILKEHPEWALTVLRKSADGKGIDRKVFPDRPDLRRKEVVQRFIQLTHERYYQELGGEAWENVRGIFTDEPFFGNFQIIKTDWDNYGMPWTPDFPAEFQRNFHYSADDAVRKIFFGTQEESARAIRNAREVLSKIAFRNYFGTLKKWCHAHNILSLGHTGGEHMPTKMAQLYGDGFEMYKEFDIPGLDTIAHQIFPAEHETDFPKYVTSAARHSGKRRVFSESYAVYGYDSTFEEMRQTADAQYVLGVTDIVPMALYYSSRKSRQFEHCCNLFAPDPRWKFYSGFAAYTTRMTELMSSGKMTAEIAMLLPYSAYLQPETVNSYPDGIKFLQENHYGYDYVGEYELLRSAGTPDTLRIGKAVYKVLIVPPEEQLTGALKQKIAELKKAGFPIVADNESYRVQEFLAPDLPMGENSGTVRVLRLKKDNSFFYLFFNADREKVSTTCLPDKCHAWEWYDVSADTSYPAEPNGSGKIAFELNGLSSVILRRRTRKCMRTEEYKKLPLSGAWTKKMRKYFVFSDNGFKEKTFRKSSEGLCGECGIFDFVNSFTCNEVPAECKLFLDCTANGMWEIIINGKSVEKSPWTPFSADISRFVKKGKNRIVCRLTTPAGGVYRSQKNQEYMQERGWFNDCVKRTLQFSPAVLPSTEKLPDFLYVKNNMER